MYSPFLARDGTSSPDLSAYDMASPLDWNPLATRAPVTPTTPFDATPLGYATNFYKAIPGELGSAAKDIAQGTLQSFLSLGNTLLGTVDKNRRVYQVPASLQPLVGATEIKDLPAQYQDLHDRIANSPTAKKYGIDKFAGPLAFGGILGKSILDYSPFGGEERVAAEALARTTDEATVRSMLKRMGADSDIAAKFAPDIAKLRTTAEVEDVLHTVKGLHTLKAADRATKAEEAVARGESPDVTGMMSGEIAELSRKPKYANDFEAANSPEYGTKLSELTKRVKPDLTISIKDQNPNEFREGHLFKEGPIDEYGRAAGIHLNEKTLGDFNIGDILYPGEHAEDAFAGNGGGYVVVHISDSGDISLIKTQTIDHLKQEALTAVTGEKPVVVNLADHMTDAEKFRKQEIERRNAERSQAEEKPNVTLLSPDEAAQAAEFGAAKRARELRGPAPAAAPRETVIRQSLAKNIEPLLQGPDGPSWQKLIKGYFSGNPAAQKAHVLDYFGTPEFVLEKLGLHKGAELLQDAKDLRRTELKKAITKILAWKEQVPSAESSMKIFQYLDGKAKDVFEYMTPKELEIAREIKQYLKEWATRLKLPEENQISEYITHLFESTPVKKGENPFDDPDLRLVMESTPAKSVYDPFLQKRIGNPGYKEDVWAALDAYVKRGTRKEAFDPALEKLSEESAKLPGTAYQYVSRLTHRINMRPTELDELVDNLITSTPIGYRFTERPTTVLSRKIRTTFYRGTLGLNVSSALRNLSQGANTYAKLGEKYSIYGYTKLFGRLLTNNLKDLYDAGILDEGAIEDKKIGVYKTFLQKLDPVLFSMFDLAEKVNRGAAFYGARARGIDKGLSTEEAEKYAKRIVRETQFAFGNVDSPVALSSDIVKTALQLQSYSVKQIEFLSRMAKNKEYGGLVRYTLASFVFLATIGRMFGMKPDQLLPSVGLSAPSTTLISGLFGLMNQNDEERAKAISDLQRSLVTTIPAGAQLRKTLQGLKAVSKGRDETPAGNFRFAVPQDLPTALQAGLFGKSALPQAQAYYKKLNGRGSASSNQANPLNL